MRITRLIRGWQTSVFNHILAIFNTYSSGMSHLAPSSIRFTKRVGQHISSHKAQWQRYVPSVLLISLGLNMTRGNSPRSVSINILCVNHGPFEELSRLTMHNERSPIPLPPLPKIRFKQIRKKLFTRSGLPRCYKHAFQTPEDDPPVDNEE
jgi:hypothetical protein